MKNNKTKIIVAVIITCIIIGILFTGHNIINLLIKMHGG
jgi:hypothetical protein